MDWYGFPGSELASKLGIFNATPGQHELRGSVISKNKESKAYWMPLQAITIQEVRVGTDDWTKHLRNIISIEKPRLGMYV